MTSPGTSEVSRAQDFSFAFKNARFSDCVLRVHVGGLAGGGCHQQNDQKFYSKVVEVPASTLILVAKSGFFKTMFTGSFREGRDNKLVDIHIQVEEEESFMGLLESFYTGHLPHSLVADLRKLLQLLLAADKFECSEAIAASIAALQSHLPQMQPAEALLILDLPESILAMPKFLQVIGQARDSVNAAYSSVLKSGGEHNTGPGGAGLLELSEGAMETLLEADFVEVGSEDCVAEAALAWVQHRFAGAQQQREAVCRVVMPRVRLLSLSPQMLHTLCALAAHHIKGSLLSDRYDEPDCARVSGHEACSPGRSSSSSGVIGHEGLVLRTRLEDTSGEAGYLNMRQETSSQARWLDRLQSADLAVDLSMDVTPTWQSSCDRAPATSFNQSEGRTPAASYCAGLGVGVVKGRTGQGPWGCSETEGAQKTPQASAEMAVDVIVNALVASAEQRLVEKGAIPLGLKVSDCLVGVPQAPPRPGCELPHGAILVEVPLKRCREWVPSNSFLAVSSDVLVEGRWFTLNVQVCAGNPCLGVYLICDKSATFPGGQVQNFALDYRFCIQTAASFPAYQQVVKSRVVFTEQQLGWGRASMVGKPWGLFLQESNFYFPDGALRLRADLWVGSRGPMCSDDVSL